VTNGKNKQLGKASGRSRGLLALLVGLLATVALIASGAPSAAAQTRVGPQSQNLILTVGVQAAAAPKDVGVRGLPLRQHASATGVAAEEGAAAGKELVPYYPANGGFVGEPTPTTLDVGTRIDRYGSPYGKYASPEGTPYYQRSLPPGSDGKPYSIYELTKPLRVQSGTVAPAFGELGGGTQYLLPRSVRGLIDDAFLKEVSP
jgi:hypothetical protein